MTGLPVVQNATVESPPAKDHAAPQRSGKTRTALKRFAQIVSSPLASSGIAHYLFHISSAPAAEGPANSLQTTFSRAYNFIGSGVRNLPDTARSVYQGAQHYVGAAVDMVSDGISNVIDFAVEKARSITQSLSDEISEARDIRSDLNEAIARGDFEEAERLQGELKAQREKIVEERDKVTGELRALLENNPDLDPASRALIEGLIVRLESAGSLRELEAILTELEGLQNAIELGTREVELFLEAAMHQNRIIGIDHHIGMAEAAAAGDDAKLAEISEDLALEENVIEAIEEIAEKAGISGNSKIYEQIDSAVAEIGMAAEGALVSENRINKDRGESAPIIPSAARDLLAKLVKDGIVAERRVYDRAYQSGTMSYSEYQSYVSDWSDSAEYRCSSILSSLADGSLTTKVINEIQQLVREEIRRLEDEGIVRRVKEKIRDNRLRMARIRDRLGILYSAVNNGRDASPELQSIYSQMRSNYLAQLWADRESEGA